LCGSKKFQLYGWSLEILRGWGSQKPIKKKRKGKEGRKLNWNFRWGRGLQTEAPSVGGGMDIFCNNTL